eukprot:CAMPEP_0198520014 /NCGR_PEP_ID=MMETSP1462-20131121/20064_1 /TAXON_ID=1333877 /ORGANISM="Brandtodinium nutriculum, Strain RCC3387" /LENGTH=204 /DNA_ID=CAMNT_0044249637 /DNA_START=76 /DNA_END=687 /DNA_ORIENTATION=-
MAGLSASLAACLALAYLVASLQGCGSTGSKAQGSTVKGASGESTDSEVVADNSSDGKVSEQMDSAESKSSEGETAGQVSQDDDEFKKIDKGDDSESSASQNDTEFKEISVDSPVDKPEETESDFTDDPGFAKSDASESDSQQSVQGSLSLSAPILLERACGGEACGEAAARKVGGAATNPTAARSPEADGELEKVALSDGTSGA